MELTKFRYNIKSDAFVDLYGNILRVCSDCNKLKDHDFFNGTQCKSCKYIKEKEKGGVAYLERHNKAVKKHRYNNGFLSKQDKEKEYYTKHNGKHCNVYFNRCIVTGEIFATDNKFKLINNKIESSGDYKNKNNLLRVIKNKGRYHNCSQCNTDIDLLLNGKFVTKYCFCTKECRIIHSKESKDNRRHIRRGRLSLNHERVSRSKVFKNDNYTCYICNVKVIVYKDLKDKWNKKDAATLDHVIALANGGTHTYSNIKTCCSWCNSNKRDK